MTVWWQDFLIGFSATVLVWCLVMGTFAANAQLGWLKRIAKALEKRR